MFEKEEEEAFASLSLPLLHIISLEVIFKGIVINLLRGIKKKNLNLCANSEGIEVALRCCCFKRHLLYISFDLFLITVLLVELQTKVKNTHNTFLDNYI